ncbi:serine carboxypeptidase S28 [Colletotrichum graminicola]|uniref:Serine carboxypeptidase S28 n=1 Tax=Colletotrichum graminicola (strain M1.001 / M2 / FGSC 10212) TaxID=645133 RepID=E3QKV3_COLGM|nr:serine carboxypeptidase S28 [Colletotrichum graminicola M1.001]EFQ31491.1 serine carboxypeptidase S28 [Colletotrichum graminicola M1.001]WDK19800.1 serine carboxypeptidase S28 [Colletotrichum graminicola]
MKVPLALLTCLTAAAQARFAFRPTQPPFKADDVDGLLSKRALGSFEQLIDHNDPELGTFQQRFWWNSTFWKGPGSPIVLFTPGEEDAEEYTGYLTDRALTGAIAKEIGGAVIMVEHRNWGTSLPYALQDTKNLQQHTVANAVQDLVYFARNVELPFDTNSSSNAPQAPWVYTGGSYSGYLAAAIAKLAPGTFWAYHASSAPVEAINYYWSYFLPIQEGMPKNCSRDFERIIEHVDTVLNNGTKDEIYALKKKFLMQDLPHDDDFASALSSPLGLWQSIQQYDGYSEFYQMCDTVEGVAGNATSGNSTAPGPDGVGLPKALDNLAAWWRANMIKNVCASYRYKDWQDPMSVACWDTYNASSPGYTDWSAANVFGRTWYWMLCNEPLFYWQTGAPEDRPTIVSRLTTPEYFQRQCGLFFPKQGEYTFAADLGKTADDVNKVTGGWDFTNTTRLVWTNGGFDPWRSASVSSELRPGGPLQSRPGAPVNLIPGSRHCNDLLTENAEVNADVRAAVTAEVAQLKTWVAEFYNGKVTQKRRIAATSS